MTILQSTRDEQFRAHCPNCSHINVWYYLVESGSGDIVGRICQGGVPTREGTFIPCNYTMVTPANEAVSIEVARLFKQAIIMLPDTGRADRVRALVLALLQTHPANLEPFAYADVVQLACRYDAEIEKLRA